MQIEFGKRDLQILYETGECRKLRLPEEVIRDFTVTVRMLEAAKYIYDLWQEPSLHFEKLQGANPGDTVSFQATFPPDHPDQQKALQPGSGEVNLAEVLGEKD